MIWYVVGRWGREKIQEIEVVRDTDKFIVVMERYLGRERERRIKKDGWEKYFPTKDAAIDSLLNKAIDSVESAKRSLRSAEEAYDEIVALKSAHMIATRNATESVTKEE